MFKNFEEAQVWAVENIIWAGSRFTNKSDRQRMIPQAIVNHMSQGTMESCIEWFNDKDNTDSSAHFLVSKNGQIFQFVPIDDNAWANGITIEQIKDAKAEIVKVNEPYNPNWYTVSIEHEGRYEESKGKLTPIQLEASIKLHAYIIAYVRENFKYDIVADEKTILGHSDINPVGKPFCPGEQFPIDAIISALRNEAPQIAFSDIKGHWAEKTIIRAKELGIVAGFPDGTFKPDEEATRAQMVALVMSLYDFLNK